MTGNDFQLLKPWKFGMVTNVPERFLAEKTAMVFLRSLRKFRERLLSLLFTQGNGVLRR